MKVYSVIWSTATALTGLVGVTLALSSESAYAVAGLFATVAVCAGVISANLRALETGSSRSVARRVVPDAVAAGVAGVACFGLGTATGPWLAPVVAGLTITSPPVCSLIRRWLTGSRRSATTGVSAISELPPGALATWTDPELYAVWKATRTEITRATEAQQAVTAARARQLLLAEIERRYPAQTRAWMSSQAAIAGEPPEFLHT